MKQLEIATQNIILVEAISKDISVKYQLHHPYGFSDAFLLFIFILFIYLFLFSFWLPWQPMQFRCFENSYVK